MPYCIPPVDSCESTASHNLLSLDVKISPPNLRYTCSIATKTQLKSLPLAVSLLLALLKRSGIAPCLWGRHSPWSLLRRMQRCWPDQANLGNLSLHVFFRLSCLLGLLLHVCSRRNDAAFICKPAKIVPSWGYMFWKLVSMMPMTLYDTKSCSK